ncbi:phage/plasmid primase, P4 family [Devosia sp.]|uniref:phage/plasmid primase, P4 family n=1 Tax=Devosia sp. TaxID=1871048 RepID=UPI0032645E2A
MAHLPRPSIATTGLIDKSTRVKPRKKKITHARALAADGLAVLPVFGITNGICTCAKGSACQKPGKHPIINDWVSLASKSKAQIIQWWSDHPSANVGVATGEKSGVLVLDIDPKNGGTDSLESAIKLLGKLPETPTVNTGGGGKHYYFRYPTVGVKTSRTAFGPGIDVQSNGAYVVAPPSRHVSGEAYKWQAEHNFGELSLAELPDAWLNRLSSTAERAKKIKPDSAGTPSAYVEGGRNDGLTRLAGKLRNDGLSDDAMLEALLAQNRDKCRPPLSDDEVRRIVMSAQNFTRHKEGGDDAENLAHEVLAKHFQGGETLIFADDGQLWSFKGTHWSPLKSKSLDKDVLLTIQARGERRRSSTTNLISQTRALIQMLSVKDGDPLRFNGEPPRVINTRGGELWVMDDGHVELRKHAPGSYLRHCLDVDYDKEATCPKYDAAISTIFSGRKKMVRLWHELAGYAIQPGREIALVVICKGEGSNGKTKLVETLTKLIGKDSVAAMPVADLDKSRFTTGSLIDKLLFVDDDVKSGTVLPDGQLKRISEAKTVSGEHKFGNQFQFIVRTLPILLCNNPPSLNDVSNGMTRRLLVIPFDRRFEDKDIDHKLFPAIWASEMPGILNRAVEGLKRVMANNWQLSPPNPVRMAKVRYINEANPVPGFIDAQCEKGNGTLLGELYTGFEVWCESTGIKAIQRSAFKRGLESRSYRTKKSNKGVMVLGIELKTGL